MKEAAMKVLTRTVPDDALVPFFIFLHLRSCGLLHWASLLASFLLRPQARRELLTQSFLLESLTGFWGGPARLK